MPGPDFLRKYAPGARWMGLLCYKKYSFKRLLLRRSGVCGRLCRRWSRRLNGRLAGLARVFQFTFITPRKHRPPHNEHQQQQRSERFKYQ